MKSLLMRVFKKIKNKKKFLELFQKTKTKGGEQTPTKPFDIQKQNVKALKYIDYARRLRMYGIRKLRTINFHSCHCNSQITIKKT